MNGGCRKISFRTRFDFRRKGPGKEKNRERKKKKCAPTISTVKSTNQSKSGDTAPHRTGTHASRLARSGEKNKKKKTNSTHASTYTVLNCGPIFFFFFFFHPACGLISTPMTRLDRRGGGTEGLCTSGKQKQTKTTTPTQEANDANRPECHRIAHVRCIIVQNDNGPLWLACHGPPFLALLAYLLTYFLFLMGSPKSRSSTHLNTPVHPKPVTGKKKKKMWCVFFMYVCM